jgi:DNA polymerase III sliding clamp (beta) subunit (PCNA family)
MKITVANNDLNAALQVGAISLASGDDALSSHFLFRKRNGKVEVLTFQNRVCTMTPMTCQVEGDDGDAFTVEGWRLVQWTRAIGAVAVTFESQGDGTVKAVSPRITSRFKSLDPSKFPFWDKTLEESKLMATLKGSRLSAALGYAKDFISGEDTTKADITVAEMLRGSLWATDGHAMSLVTVKGLENSTLRLHGKDISSVTKFLGIGKDDDIEVLEHDRQVSFRRVDGSVLGAARPLNSFPRLSVKQDGEDEFGWEIKQEEIRTAVLALTASAEKHDPGVKIRFDSGDKKIVFSVDSAAGGGEDAYPIECQNPKNMDTLAPFIMEHRYLATIMRHFNGEALKFGVSKTSKGGFVRFRHEVGEDSFLTVVAWRN